ncbi:hypothetical protein [Ligilactobacillus salivarius]|uniref:hypothetical protein n=1 Tax=Ligilactobacillus salivarius TaxID=1624 RepID=UPI00254B8870|nr:hypothetical protein [Ligilactobacillus salivarius]
MKINYKSDSSNAIYQVGNVIKNCTGALWLIADNVDGGHSVVNLTTDQIFGTYDTLESLIRNAGDESDTLVNVEINVL